MTASDTQVNLARQILAMYSAPFKLVDCMIVDANNVCLLAINQLPHSREAEVIANWNNSTVNELSISVATGSMVVKALNYYFKDCK